MKKKNFNNTRRKTKIIGTEIYINQATGEIKPCQVIEIEERDANFKKLWLGHLLEAVEELGSKKLIVLTWLFDNADAYNRIIGTTRQIALATKISPTTVQATLGSLVEKNIIKRETNVITLNPSVIFQGGINARFNVLFTYNNIGKNKQEDNSEEIEQIMQKNEKDYFPNKPQDESTRL